MSEKLTINTMPEKECQDKKYDKKKSSSNPAIEAVKDRVKNNVRDVLSK
jgi:hypothetical protein